MSLFRKPNEEGYDALFAESSFITEIQLAIEAALDQKGLTQADLARILDVSEARVSQILGGNGRNLQARTIARIAHALGRTAFVDFIEEEAGWLDEGIAAEQKIPVQAFSEWMVFSMSLSGDTQVNDNGWALPAEGCANERLVAA